MAKSKKTKQNWPTPENFDICFCIGFDRYYQKLFFKGRMDTSLFFHPILIFSCFLISWDRV